MLGCEILVHRQVPGENRDEPSLGSRIASWNAALGGLDWLDALVAQGRATDLGGNGYPCRFLARAGDVLAKMSGGPPKPRGPMVIGDDYVLPGNWTGAFGLDREKFAACNPDEELIIEAWDLS
jgi:hypothetical protein